MCNWRSVKGQALVAIGSLQPRSIDRGIPGRESAGRRGGEQLSPNRKLRADDIVTERKLIRQGALSRNAGALPAHPRTTGQHGDFDGRFETGPAREKPCLHLTAPIAGTVVIQNAVRGQGVGPGDELFEVVDTSRVWVFANLPIEQARRFKEGDSGTITPKGGDAIVAPLTTYRRSRTKPPAPFVSDLKSPAPRAS